MTTANFQQLFNFIWSVAQCIVKASDSDWFKGAKGMAQKKLFREVFTEIDPDAEPVIAKHGKRARAVRWADLPNQTLPEGMDIGSLDPLFGVYPDKDGNKQTEYDRETAHIDTLIAEKERMLALLEEKRAAVTGEIDPK